MPERKTKLHSGKDYWSARRHLFVSAETLEERRLENTEGVQNTEGVLGALGVSRAAFQTIAQAEPLRKQKIKVPIMALGADKGLGTKVQETAKAAAANLEGSALPDCGHFIPENAPGEAVRNIQARVEKKSGK